MCDLPLGPERLNDSKRCFRNKGEAPSLILAGSLASQIQKRRLTPINYLTPSAALGCVLDLNGWGWIACTDNYILPRSARETQSASRTAYCADKQRMRIGRKVLPANLLKNSLFYSFRGILPQRDGNERKSERQSEYLKTARTWWWIVGAIWIMEESAICKRTSLKETISSGKQGLCSWVLLGTKAGIKNWYQISWTYRCRHLLCSSVYSTRSRSHDLCCKLDPRFLTGGWWLFAQIHLLFSGITITFFKLGISGLNMDTYSVRAFCLPRYRRDPQIWPQLKPNVFS